MSTEGPDGSTVFSQALVSEKRAGTGNKPLLEIRHVTYTYVSEFTDDEVEASELGDPALSDVSFEVRPGTCVLFVGPSGQGKTSITRLCNGIIPQYHPGVLEGDILWKGEDMVQMPLADLSKGIGSVFQNPRSQFFCTDTTNEVAFACENFCMPRPDMLKRVACARDAFRLEGLLGRDIFRLSGGQRQRIACASVWAYAPDLYVFDEPSSNLDLASILDLRGIMERLKFQGAAMVVAEHRIFYLMDLIDEVCVVDKGRIAARYTPEEFASLSFERRMKLGVRVQSLVETRKLLPKPQGAHDVERRTCSSLEVNNLDVRLLSFGLRPTRVLDIGHLDLPLGEVVALIGPNGAGKTTFVRSLVGLERARRGTFELDGHALSRAKRSRMSYLVMQDVEAQLFTDSVFNEVALSMRKAGTSLDEAEIKQAVTDLLNKLDLANLADRHPLSLSGGQKQRVVIAGALASGARIVAFDEPTSGLDFLHMRQVAQLVDGLADPSRLTLIITHDVEFIALCCTQVIELEHGEVRAHYPVDSDGLERVIGTLGKLASPMDITRQAR